MVAPNIYYAKSYGAKGDGSTNDLAYIQNAIDAASANYVAGYGAGVVYFSPGTFVCGPGTATNSGLSVAPGGYMLLLKTGVNLLGAGMGNTILKAGYRNNLIIAYQYNYIGVHEMTLDGSTLIDNADPLKLSACQYATIRNVEIKGGGSYGANVIGCSDVLLENVYAHDILDSADATKGTGFSVSANGALSTQYNSLRVKLKNCTANACANTGFDITRNGNHASEVMRGISLEGCIATGHTTNNGIGFRTLLRQQTTANVVLANCYANGNKNGYDFNDSWGVHAANCVSYANTTRGFRLIGSKYCSLVGCESIDDIQGFTAMASQVFATTPAQYNSFMGCVARSPNSLMSYGYRGLAAAGDSDHNVIQGGYYEGSTAAMQVDPTDKISRTQGYVAENNGSATILNGTTSITVTHGLSFTPGAGNIQIMPTATSTNDPGPWWATGLSSTQFVVNVRNDPGASGWPFEWFCHRV
jgi:hypothetical protein